ncbi:hypothetical protein SELMODRAFT_86848 [Selaginella moellendorffii]|uniref:BHLH domain-containing protein n=1 Tax=Selaginella moellendorffii TaxID=88036 RepID=D8R8Q3_SELML|nr:hypothetical protein SELMODRAFT_86848 [Selaginella moellendorffii]
MAGFVVLSGWRFLQDQCGLEHQALVLSRHLSLRKELQDSVPCKLRARRGCATHPRSVAERVRRTKISEGIKRLHDLVPNMDKQTNTADMLNHAMEYMKQLKEKIEQMKEV